MRAARRPTAEGTAPLLEAVVGGLAGLGATIAMTVAADILFRRLPPPQRYPLPPRELTETILHRVGLVRALDEPGLQAASLLAHFGFGAGAGMAFGAGAPGRAQNALCGAAYGLVVYVLSYLGWIPALGLLRPATGHPPHRTALMIAAHLVWGASLGALARRLSLAMTPLAGGPLRDR